MKKLFAALMSAAMLFALAACSNGGSSSAAPTGDASTPVEPAATGEGYTIAVAMNALDEYQTMWLGFFTEYAEGLGHTVVTTNADSSVDKQLSDVDALIQNRPDVILIRSTDTEGVAPAFQAVVDAGIPCVDSDFGTAYDGEGVLYLESSQYVHGANQAQWCMEYLAANPDETIRAGYVWGSQGQKAVQDRYDGWAVTMQESEYADRFEILVEKVCNWSATETMDAVEDWMMAYPDMNVIVAASDEMAIAAVNVLEANNRTGEVFVLGVDGSTNGQQHIRDGLLAGSSYIPTDQIAFSNVDYAVRLCEGETDLLGQHIDIGTELTKLMTIDNIDALLG